MTDNKTKTKNFLVPKHIVLSEEEKNALLEKYNVIFSQLPNIALSDPALEELDAQVGDIIKIIRISKTNKISEYFRGVTNE